MYQSKNYTAKTLCLNLFGILAILGHIGLLTTSLIFSTEEDEAKDGEVEKDGN